MSALDPDLGKELAKELNATLQTRKELGPEYESELIDSFLDKVGQRIDSQVERRLQRELAEHHHGEAPTGLRGERRGYDWRGSRVARMSLVLAIPLSAIGGGNGHLTGLVVTWAGIVGVNVAHALGLAARRGRSDRRRSEDW